MTTRSPPPGPDPWNTPGFRFATCPCGIKPHHRTDLLLVAMDPGTTVAGVFTQNQVVAAPVVLCRERLPQGQAQALIVNSGNANVANGPQGMQAARTLTQAAARLLAVPEDTVFIASTGVIGEHFPVERPLAALPKLVQDLSSQRPWLQAAQAIMTTDAHPKLARERFLVDGQPVHMVGIAKGAGMIHPNMATMLSFVFTDATLSKEVLQQHLRHAVNQTFNRAIVDGDTSTNDTVLAFASGKGAVTLHPGNSTAMTAFATALESVCGQLARMIVADGEGATKFVTIEVTGASSQAHARTVAATVAKSPLVKTAFAGSDPNWGRILAAVGYSGVPLQVDRIAIFLDQVPIVAGGVRAPDYQEAQGAAVMAQKEITIRIDLGSGQERDTVWTCDLTHEYISINADYRS
ncbi:MAG TPA: bifunctional glutamate N-acetyltransferase/amino-acid acetyltransferase ArgJ [Magnetococcales bacterium]|nr:bifunctional glutamate N-acetyltransferase/amino-acid acetyltransferase ArgJ [Magnetococcales bacterium]